MIKNYNLQKLLSDPKIVDEKIKEHISKKLLFTQDIDINEIEGHIEKAENNLRFIVDVMDKGYFDWALTGCYYACYHSALSLIQTKGYSSKNHLATLLIIIKEFYKKELTRKDIENLSNFLDYKDLLFYVNAKNKREEATYSTNTLFDKKEVEKIRIETVIFVNKIKEIIEKSIKRPR